MFTGFIEATGNVLQCLPTGLVVERPKMFADVRIGSSIAVSGVCLTVTELDQGSLRFDLSEETLRRTTLGALRQDACVNLERALKVGDRFEGHIVQGHVDAVGEVVSLVPRLTSLSPSPSPTGGGGMSKQREGLGERVVTLAFPPTLQGLIVEKGSITLDGVSLTIASIEENHCTIALIPFTRTHTTLGSLKEGDRVNLETDILGKYLRALSRR